MTPKRTVTDDVRELLKTCHSPKEIAQIVGAQATYVRVVRWRDRNPGWARKYMANYRASNPGYRERERASDRRRYRLKHRRPDEAKS